MVPLSTIRDMVIAGTLTPIQGCNMPTCRISKENDNKLRLAGWASNTPNIYLFWQRYTSCIDAKFKTYGCGPPIASSTLFVDIKEDSYFLTFI